jgi:kumamolisin
MNDEASANAPLAKTDTAVMPGTDRQVRSGATLVGAADPESIVILSIYLRSQPGAPALPDQDYYAQTPLSQRTTLTRAQLAAQHGSSSADLQAVVAFSAQAGLQVLLSDPNRRLVQVSGTVAQCSKAFGVQLSMYSSPDETYRGYEGSLHLPSSLLGVVQGVFGLDNRRLARHSSRNVSFSHPASPVEVAATYDFPWPKDNAQGQTIAILEFSGPEPLPSSGFQQSDIDSYIQSLNQSTSNPWFTNFLAPPYTSPVVRSVPVQGSPGNVQSGSAKHISGSDTDIEVALDVEVVAAVAQGAKIVVYFAPFSEQGWVDAITQINADTEHDPSVLTISYGWAELVKDGGWFELTGAALNQISNGFQRAASIGMTVLASSGDLGSTGNTLDGRAHVEYPASDPWVLACGGTVLAGMSPLSESTWSQSGGGISDMWPVPAWQAKANTLQSANGNNRVGRGVPDIAGPAQPGYPLWVYGQPSSKLQPAGSGLPLVAVGGTSAVAPLYASLVALLNAQLGTRLGYLNPILYSLAGTDVFRDLNDGVSNKFEILVKPGTPPEIIPGYTSTKGWDAVTGLGSINGFHLMCALSNELHGPAVIKGFSGNWNPGVLVLNWSRSGGIPQKYAVSRYTGKYASDAKPDFTAEFAPNTLEQDNGAPIFDSCSYYDSKAETTGTYEYRLVTTNFKGTTEDALSGVIGPAPVIPNEGSGPAQTGGHLINDQAPVP